MSTSKTSTTDFDTMCTIILEATKQDGVVWEQQPHWDLTVDTIYRYLNDSITDDDDLTVVNASFDDMLESIGLSDIGFVSYQHILNNKYGT